MLQKVSISRLASRYAHSRLDIPAILVAAWRGLHPALVLLRTFGIHTWTTNPSHDLAAPRCSGGTVPYPVDPSSMPGREAEGSAIHAIVTSYLYTSMPDYF